jgi:hypothetical protein
MWKPDKSSTSTNEPMNKAGSYIRPPFKIDTNESLPKKLIPKDGFR